MFTIKCKIFHFHIFYKIFLLFLVNLLNFLHFYKIEDLTENKCTQFLTFSFEKLLIKKAIATF